MTDLTKILRNDIGKRPADLVLMEAGVKILHFVLTHRHHQVRSPLAL